MVAKQTVIRHPLSSSLLSLPATLAAVAVAVAATAIVETVTLLHCVKLLVKATRDRQRHELNWYQGGLISAESSSGQASLFNCVL